MVEAANRPTMMGRHTAKDPVTQNDNRNTLLAKMINVIVMNPFQASCFLVIQNSPLCNDSSYLTLLEIPHERLNSNGIFSMKPSLFLKPKNFFHSRYSQSI